MKIALLNIYNGVIDRGAETFVYELATRLSKNNKIVVFQSGDVDKNNEYETRTIEVNWDWRRKSGEGKFISRFYLDYWSRQIFVFTLKTVKYLWKEKFDVVIPVNGGWMPIIVRLITILRGSKMVISGQSGIGWDDAVNLWSFPDVFVPLSTTAKKWAKKINPLANSVYISNGVDTKRFKKSKNRIKQGQKTILCVGAFTKQKRLDLAIRAVERTEDTKLLIAGGGGDLEGQVKSLGTRLLGNRFELISVKYEKMPEIYRSADLFTFPTSPTEAFGNVVVEAMASGLPVVATNDPIRKEIIGNAGLFVDPTNINEYSEALQRALSIDWADKPRRQAEKFDWDIIAEKYEELLKAL